MMLEPKTTQADLAVRAAQHVAETMHVEVATVPWPDAASLPRFLSAAYGFVVATIDGNHALWLLAEKPETPGTLRKQIVWVAEAWDGPLAVVFRDLTASQRQRLVAAGVPFVVPGRQVYLPELGVDLRERTRKPPSVREKLRPAAQALLLWTLYGPAHATHTSTEALQALGYDRMTLSRSIGELEALGAVLTGPTRAPRSFRLAKSPRLTWDAMVERLTNPISTTLEVEHGTPAIAEAPLAGLSALAGYSQLSAPRTVTRALPNKLVRQLAMEATEPGLEEADVLQVWSYDPRLLAKGDAVDPLSLYLTLREDADERVQQALAAMLAEALE